MNDHSHNGGTGFEPGAAVRALYELTHLLRRECPWDQAQTAGTIVPHTLEEAYEVADAVARVESALAQDPGTTDALHELEDELGDLLFQVCFLAMWCEEHNPSINLDSVATAIHTKLVRRHPHVFGDQSTATDADDVRQRWESVKREQEARGLFDGIPESMPALGRARKLQSRAGSIGFDVGTARDALAKVVEETHEVRVAIEAASEGDTLRGSENAPPDPDVVAEIGDVLFAVVNTARLARVDPELALRASNERFRDRIDGAISLAAAKGVDFTTLPLDEQEAWYQRSKAQLLRASQE